MRRDDVCVIGAGPFGLTAAAHLRAAGLNVRVFGEVMSFWRVMPCGMLLRSTREGISLSDPQNALSIADYEKYQNAKVTTPVDRAEYISYVEWFQRIAVPEIDTRMVREINKVDGGFRMTLSDGETVETARVVVAIGLDAFKRKLSVFEGLSSALTPHSFDERTPEEHRGQRVLVVGSGQSALESASLFHRAGADVEVVSRAPAIHWLTQPDHINRERSLWMNLLYPPGALGPPGINWIVQTPGLFRSLPGSVQRLVFDRTVRPAVSARLKPETSRMRTTFGCEVKSATIRSNRIKVELSDGSERMADHVVQATGFEVRMERFGFFSPDILRSIKTIRGEPRLGTGFESSVPGLHFLGSASDLSYGPLMRAIAGTRFSASAVATLASTSLERKGPMTWIKTMEMLEQSIGLGPGLATSSARAAAVAGIVAPLLGVDASALSEIANQSNQTGAD